MSNDKKYVDILAVDVTPPHPFKVQATGEKKQRKRNCRLATLFLISLVMRYQCQNSCRKQVLRSLLWSGCLRAKLNMGSIVYLVQLRRTKLEYNHKNIWKQFCNKTFKVQATGEKKQRKNNCRLVTLFLISLVMRYRCQNSGRKQVLRSFLRSGCLRTKLNKVLQSILCS